MNKTIVTIVGIVVIVAVLSGFFVLGQQEGGLKGPQETQLETAAQSFIVGQKAPSFVLKDFEGNEVRLSDFYGKKAVILDFWAAWCPFCVAEMPELEKAQQAFRKDLVMIGVHRTDSGESIATGKKFADEQGVSYLLMQGTSEIYKASTRAVAGMPVAVFIDKNGVVQDIKIGPKTEEEIRAKVAKLLK